MIRTVFSILAVLLMLVVGCDFSKTVNKISLTIKNLPVDSCDIRIHHIVTGKEIFSDKNISLSTPIMIPPLMDDMYILVISWPKTFIPHNIFKSKSFNIDESVDVFEWTKPFYFSKKNGGDYTINITKSITIEELETIGSSLLEFDNPGCKDCDLSDEYWSLYNSFFNRKKLMEDSLKAEYYDFVNKQDLQNAQVTYRNMLDFQANYKNDEQLDIDINKKIEDNLGNPVSTFFLFYQLFNNKEFDKYYINFKKLKGSALDSKYYKMVKKQYVSK